MDVITTEDGAGWLAFLRSLVARDLCRGQLVNSDAHEGLKASIESLLTGALWQRCRYPCHAPPAHPRAQAVPVRGGHPGAGHFAQRTSTYRPSARHTT
jgi:hypothetical protein